MDRKRSREVEPVETKSVPAKKSRILIPTGSTLLNLAFSDQYDGGIQPGTMVNIVGDSHAGKSLLAWTIFTEAAHNKAFKDYRLIYDESEAAFFMDIQCMFGLKEGRVETDIRSSTIEEFYGNVLRAIRHEDKKPFIYILDSFDGIGSSADQDRATAYEKGKEAGGSFKMDKQKLASEMFRMIVDELQNTQSTLIVISQTRDAIGVLFGDKKTRSGGNALRFYSTHEVWLSIVGHEKSKEREIGADIRFRVKKNKLTGKRREGKFSVYFDYGIDDLTSCIDFLIDEKVWSSNRGKVITGSEKFPDASGTKFIQYIEENNLENDLRQLVGETWNRIEDSIRLDRKSKYAEDDK